MTNQQKKKDLLAIDLFCGCGGLTLGLKRAGFKIIGAIDNDPIAIETYKENHPEVNVWENDIRKINISSLRKTLGIKKGDLDLLAGCPPCQGFSNLRTLNGAKKIIDNRNDLIFEFLRFVKELRPKTIMMENVPGLMKDLRFSFFYHEIAMLGYKINYNVLNAGDYGVPQRRKRLLLLAGRKQKITFADKIESPTVKDFIRNLPKAGKSGDMLHDFPERRSDSVLRRIMKIPKNGGSRHDLPEKEQLRCHKNCDGFKDIYGRLSWNKPAPTITSGCTNPSKGRFLHPSENRSITLREAALLQTFPMDYYFSIKKGKGAVAIMIGNALPPEFVFRHALQIRKYLVCNG
jgi:DNA (cytosine-5)-methyltransferase 1